MNPYLQKYGFQEPQILEKPDPDLAIVVVIPVYNEPNLIESLSSLDQCELNDFSVEVIVVLNSSMDEVVDQNASSKEEFLKWQPETELIKFHLIEAENLPQKHAGVGLARKIGMDEAVNRFHQLGTDGIIVCFDGDSKCKSNYLREIYRLFQENPDAPGCSIHFEHPVVGNTFDERVYLGIINYELHLRYYKEAMAYCDLPYAFHTVGSSMAVRSSAYEKQGGMNKRKAGEDFYFLHKIIALGNFVNLHSTTVVPSPRSSDRVPFGTGRAIEEWLSQDKSEMTTYAFDSFEIIKAFVAEIGSFYERDYSRIPSELQEFLESNKFGSAVENCISNSSNFESFKKRFLVWFDAFQFLKCVHYLRDHHFPDQPLTQEALRLLTAKGESIQARDTKAYLMAFRTLEVGAKV